MELLFEGASAGNKEQISRGAEITLGTVFLLLLYMHFLTGASTALCVHAVSGFGLVGCV